MAHTVINWHVSNAEHDLISAIVDRTFSEYPDYPDTRGTLIMDLTAVHANGCPLKLAELLQAESFDFAHDVYGIRRHIDRRTGQLMDCFSPRYSA